MGNKKIQRAPLVIKPSSDIIHISPSAELQIHIPDGYDIDVYDLSSLDYAELIVQELNIYLRSQAAVRGVANTILLYLRYVISVQGLVSVQSLFGYRDYVDRRTDIKLNSKSDIFGKALAFVRHLIGAGIVDHGDFPEYIPKEEPVHKGTFIDTVRYRLPELTAEMGLELRDAIGESTLKEHEAQALVFGNACMSALRQYAEKMVRRIIEDWNLVNDIVGEINSIDIERLKKIDFSKSEEKSMKLAISILYANYKRNIPGSSHWPKGIGDWCRKRAGWQVSRIEGAFFPNISVLTPFFVLMLTDERLTPNVDSVAFYAYIDCCKPSSEKGCFDVYFGKKRGSSPSVAIKKNDITVIALRALIQKVKAVMPELPGGNNLISKEYVPIFVHCKEKVRTVDPSMTARMVREFIKAAAKEFIVLKPLVDKITGQNFRPTHAYLKKLSGKSTYQIRDDLGHKNITTTEGYIKGVESQAIQNRRHQDFQRFLVKESAKMKRTGSGYLCAGDKEKKGCVEYLDCSECEAKRIVLANPNIAAEWIAWERTILREKDRLLTENSERWSYYWEPKLVEYQTLITLCNSNVLRKAKIISEGLKFPWLS